MTVLSSTISPDTQTTSKKLINHIIFLLDGSGSMHSRLKLVKQVFDSTFKALKSSVNDEQEIFLSVYQFDDRVRQIIFNQNIKTASADVKFTAGGMTALRDATAIAIDDHKALKLNKNEDHTFLIYNITDGADNASRIGSASLAQKIRDLDDSWTVAALVPTMMDAHNAKSSGFPAGNVQLWDISSSNGFEEVGNKIVSSYSNYSQARSQGVRSSSNIFSVNTDSLKRTDIRTNLTEVKGAMYHAQKDYVIKDMVEQFTTGEYRKGSAYYELSKTELVQDYKGIVIVSKKDGKKFGGRDARDVLGLPHHETKMKPGDFGDWRVFIQSTSVNRKIKAGTSIFVTE